MNAESDALLCKTYPLLYAEREGDPRETLMCYGFCIGDGWFGLIDRLSAKLEPLAAAQVAAGEAHARVAQVKEKFGTLRYYVDYATDEMYKLIDAAEAESSVICEKCGAPGTLRQGGWWKTLCDACEGARRRRP